MIYNNDDNNNDNNNTFLILIFSFLENIPIEAKNNNNNNPTCKQMLVTRKSFHDNLWNSVWLVANV